MKKLFTLFLALISCAGMLKAADEVVYTLTPAAGTNNAYANNCDVTIEGITWNINGNSTMLPWRIGGKSLDAVDRTLYSKTPIEANISKIALVHQESTAGGVTVNSMTVVVASDADFSSIISTLTPDFETNGTTTVSRPDGTDWSNAYYKIIYNITITATSNKFFEFVKAEFYKDGEGGGDNPGNQPGGDDPVVVGGDTLTCAQAIELALNGNTDLRVIKGYVTEIKEEWSGHTKNITFKMADTKNGTDVFTAYRVVCETEEEAPFLGDLVWAKGNLYNYSGTPETYTGGTFAVLKRDPSEPKEPMEYWLAPSSCAWTRCMKFEKSELIEGEYLLKSTFDEGNKLKIKGKDDRNLVWFPSKEADPYTIPEYGEYLIRFRPAGNSEWENGYFTVERVWPLVASVYFSDPVLADNLNPDALFKSESGAFTVQINDIDNEMTIVKGWNQSRIFADSIECWCPLFQPYVLNTGTSTTATSNYITLTIPADGNIGIFVLPDSKDATGRTMVITQEGKEIYNEEVTCEKGGVNNDEYYYMVNVPVKAGTAVITYPNGPLQFYAFGFKEKKVIETCEQARIAALSTVRSGDIYDECIKYTITGYVTEVIYTGSQYYNISVWMADTPDGGQVIQLYNYDFTTSTAFEEVPAVGDLFRVTGHLVRYYDNPEIIGSATEILIHAEKPILEPTNCAEAAEAALSVSDNNVLYNDGAVYTIPGYVTKITYYWSEAKKIMTFWMADTKDGGEVLMAYNCSIETAEDAVNEGDKVAVTGKLTKYGTKPEFATGCTVEILERAEVIVPLNLGDKTIAEFNELKNEVDTCILTGIVKNIQRATDNNELYSEYGNFYLEDESAQVYIYGLLTADKKSKQFRTMNIDEGDQLTVKAIYYGDYFEPEAKNAIYVSHTKASELTTSIRKVQQDNVPCTKIVRDGRIYILRGDKTYTVTGQEVTAQ